MTEVRLPLRRRERMWLFAPVVALGCVSPELAPLVALMLSYGCPPIGGSGWSLRARPDGLRLRVRERFVAEYIAIAWSELCRIRLAPSTSGLLVTLSVQRTGAA